MKFETLLSSSSSSLLLLLLLLLLLSSLLLLSNVTMLTLAAFALKSGHNPGKLGVPISAHFWNF